MSELATTEVPESLSVWGALGSIIDKPRMTFAALTARPRLKWVLPVALSLLVLIVSVVVAAPHSSELSQEITERQLQSMGLSPAEIEQARARGAQFNSPTATAISGSIAGVVGLAILWLLISTFLYFASLIAGAELKFGAVFVVVTWATLPLTLRSLIQTIYIALSGKFPVYPGLAALQVSGDILKDTTNPLIAVLGYADPFWLWHFILLVIGLAVAAKFSKMKSFFLVLIYGFLSIGVSAGLTLVGRLFGLGG